MSTDSPHILVIDDDPDIVRAAQMLLRRHGMAVTGAAHPDVAWTLMAQRPVDVVLLDLNFARGRVSGDEGFAMLDRLIAGDPDTVVIVVTGHSGIAVAVRAMKAGAADFVIKPWSNERLLATVERGIALRRARRDVATAPPIATDDQLLGEAPAIIRTRALVARIAASDAGVLLRGAAGTGKSLVARLIHAGANRAGGLTIVEGTGAAIADLGAHGTLVLEDVDTVPRAAQRDVARRLEGLRIVATSRLPRAALRDVLSDDLLYGLNTIEIDLPPLADREGDTGRLARHFLALFAARHGQAPKPLAEEAARALAADAWPDNVRGLRQACERAVLLSAGERYEIADFALSIEPETAVPRAAAADLNLGRSERTLVAAALQRHAFNVSRAAAELGLTRAALYRRMEKYGL
ncbi:sigma-54-dependent transcriptional regulator [uncultured Sphingomonas sp.]|uniref:sigma-54-dependent transcriptional regulator n=1 Tax=uncultured Sphingomonas sp. TaxID=158754 RepID=UPI0035CAD45C